MPYYLAPYSGTGGPGDPFRPRGCALRGLGGQAGWSAIDLRGAGGGTNVCFLHLPLSDPDPQLRLIGLDPFDTIGPALRTAIRIQVGLNALSQSVLIRLMEEILVSPDAHPWRLLPTFDGFHEIYLGGRLLSRWRQGSVGAAISDTFNRADGNLDGSTSSDGQFTWTEWAGTLFTVTTNRAQVVLSGVSDNHGRAEFDMASDAYSVQATLALFPVLVGAGSAQLGVVGQKDTSTTQTFYRWEAGRSATDGYRELGRYNAGAETSLGVDMTVMAAGDIIKLIINGSTIKGQQNGADVFSVTDASPLSGNRRTGLSCNLDNTGGATYAFDDFSAADLAAAVSVPGHGALLSSIRNAVIQRV